MLERDARALIRILSLFAALMYVHERHAVPSFAAGIATRIERWAFGDGELQQP